MLFEALNMIAFEVLPNTGEIYAEKGEFFSHFSLLKKKVDSNSLILGLVAEGNTTIF